MNNTDLYISKANFILFKRENITEAYEFYPKVPLFKLRSLAGVHMAQFIKRSKKEHRILGEQSKRF